MEELEVFVTRAEGVPLPDYRTVASSGMDLRAHLDAPVILKPLERALIPTGIRIAMPDGYEAQVRPRSGLAAQHGVTVLNTPGTIDADYRGEVKVILINLSNEPYTVQSGDRIAQLVFHNIVHAAWKEVRELPESERGSGGFGSTGKQ
ncbi:MAG: dUTP diphosphatase [Deltaproteobacteria bacterium]|jgi:dUTP pyrophosphatase|nr:dUTP diphosphatase [Deltaproteobacteria bacterium]